MKRIILLINFFLLFSSFASLHGQWVRTYGGSEGDRAYYVQQTTEGGYIVVGTTGLFQVSGLTSVWILKLDSGGYIEWEKTYSEIYKSSPLLIQETTDSEYLVAGYIDLPNYTYLEKEEAWILKLNSSGDIIADESYGIRMNGSPSCFQVTSDGGYIIASSGTNGAKAKDFWIVKLSPAWGVEWKWAYGGNASDDVRSIQQTSEGGYILCGSTTSFGAGGHDFWVLKLSSDGIIEWQRTFGGSDNDTPCSIQQTGDGGYIVIGNTNSFGAGDTDIWVLKLTPFGDVEWQKTYGGVESDTACSVQQTGDGGYIIVCNTLSFGAGEQDFWIVRLTQTGDIEWQKTFGTSQEETASFIQQSIDGGYIIIGSLSSFGAGSSDFVLIKLRPDGEIDLPCRFLQDSSAQILDTMTSAVDTSIGPEDIDLEHEFVGVDLTAVDTDAIEYELCSLNPLLSIHATIGGTTNPEPDTYVYDLNAEEVIEAIPDLGSEFTGWIGDISGLNNPITIVLDSDKFAKANFLIHQYTLTITAGEGGTTVPEPKNYLYDSMTEVTVKAIAENGYRFSEWSGDVTGTSNPIKITMDANKSVTANFFEISDKDNDIFRIKCFIATAAYGSSHHPHVKVLRDFRDKYLMTSRIGRKLVRLYYKYSPIFANMIMRHRALRIAAKIHLLPIIIFCYSMVYLGPIITMILAAGFLFLISFLFSKMKQTQNPGKLHISIRH
jgi:hypothetical protein